MCRAQLYYFVLVVTAATLASAQDGNITIQLNKIITHEDKDLYKDFIHINASSTLQVNFSDVNIALSFIIFHVHSHLYDVTLYKNQYVKGTYVTGTNIGLQSATKNGLDIFYIQNDHKDLALKLLIIVQGYGPKDPIPGGCNMEFPVPISPFMRATAHNKTYVLVDAAPAQIDVKCMDLNVDTEFYMVYLPHHNFEADVYFESISNMTSYRFIQEKGRYIDSIVKYWYMRRMLSAYPSTGAVYVAVARTLDSYSIYVPTHSYACSPLVDNDCELLDDSLSMLICALILFLGLFICFFGHKFFKTQIVALGFLSGLIVFYILLSVFLDMDHPALLAAAACSGINIGLLLLVFWWIYGLPIFVIVPFCCQIGFLVSCIAYYVAPASVYAFLSTEENFWAVFILIMLLVTIALLSISHIVNLLCCAIIGGYVAIYSMDYYLNSNMKYILNNTVRRAIWPEFRKAVLMPPFQFNDWLLTAVWLALIVSGFMYQYHQNKGKPPFPPPPRSVRAVPEEPVLPHYGDRRPTFFGVRRKSSRSVRVDERTPLLE